MDSRTYDYTFTLSNEVLARLKVCHYEQFTHVTCPCLAEGCASETIFTVRRKADPLQEGYTVRIGVGITVSEMHLVLVVLKFYTEAESVQLL
jgi:hypothetical protein